MNGEPSYIFVDRRASSGKFLSVRNGGIPMTVHFLNYLEDLLVGQTASYTKTFTDEDLTAFAQASHDDNPVHFDEEFAARDAVRRTRRPRHAHGVADFGGPRQVSSRTGVHLYDAEPALL